MKTTKFLTVLAASLAVFAACVQTQENLSFPSITMTDEAVSFISTDAPGQQIAFVANRAWTAVPSDAWIAVSPESGEGSNDTQYVTVSVLDNIGFSRSGKVSIDILFDDAVLNVTQDGPKGDAANLILYTNDFDKTVATQTFGSSSNSWPYLDQFDGWKNEKGAGASAVSYLFDKVSARNNSNSNASYSDYEGSGNNNLLFGQNGYLAVKDIALNGMTDLRLSFGTEKYDNNDKTALFNPAELPVYVSADNTKWVSLDYKYIGTAAGRWNIAECVISVPEGTASLSIYITSTKVSVHRVDDLKLEYSEEAGDAIDFSKGVEIAMGSSSSGDSGSGSGSGSTGDTNTAETATATTIADFIAKASTDTYYKLTGTIEAYTSGSYVQFTLRDATGAVAVYSPVNASEFPSIVDGGTITVAGKYKLYNSTHEVVDGVLSDYVAPVAGDPQTYKAVTAVTSGKKYLMVAGGKYAAKAIASTSTYGYPGKTDVTVTDGKISLAPLSEELLITEVTGGYTIQQKDGRFWSQTGSGNNIYLQESDTANGTVWSITANADGTLKILNITTNHYIQYSEQYNSYGSYASEGGLLPALYELEGTSEMQVTLATDATLTGWAETTHASYKNGYTVTSKGLCVSYYKNNATSDITGYPDSSSGFFRVYKDGAMTVSLTNGANITKIELECSSSTYSKNLTVSDGTTAVKDGSKITWNGNIAEFAAVAAEGQVRIKSITVTYVN